MEQTKLLRDFMEELWVCKANDQTTVLRLKAPHKDELHIERRVAQSTVCVRYYVAESARSLVKALEVVFLITETNEWLPVAFYRVKRRRHVYVQIDERTGAISPLDLVNQKACAGYCDAWSFHLRAQGWLERGVVV